MDVLHVIPAIAARYGGPSQAVLGMGQALPAHGIRVLIATTDADGQGRLQVQLGEALDWQGVRTIMFSRQFSEAFKYSRPLGRWLERHVADFAVVHIHAVFSHACLAAARACRAGQVPYIVRPLGSLDPWSMRQKPLRKRVLWQFGARSMLAGAAAVQYTTLAERRLAEDALGLRRGVVIPVGIDLANYSVRADGPDQPYVLILGRLHPKKGLEGFIPAFLDAAPPEWRLIIAGDGDAGYVARLKSLGHAGRVSFAGWLTGQAKVNALQGASLLALPSFQENFGIVVVEAMACGVPVLVSPHVNLADDITAAGAGWVAPLEPAAMRTVLREALGDRGERARRGRAGRDLAARFRWEAVAADLARLYRDLAVPAPVPQAVA